MAEKRSPIATHVNKERRWLSFYGCCNHYAAYFFHLVSILASFAASILAASKLTDGVSYSAMIVAGVAAVPGTLLATQNVMGFEYKCKWYYKKAGLLQHVLNALEFQGWDAKEASEELKKIEERMDLEWPGFGTLVVRQSEAPAGQQTKV